MKENEKEKDTLKFYFLIKKNTSEGEQYTFFYSYLGSYSYQQTYKTNIEKKISSNSITKRQHIISEDMWKLMVLLYICIYIFINYKILPWKKRKPKKEMIGNIGIFKKDLLNWHICGSKVKPIRDSSALEVFFFWVVIFESFSIYIVNC